MEVGELIPHPQHTAEVKYLKYFNARKNLFMILHISLC